ncbi:MarR family transcriptional regulator [Natrinema thermotolerans]|uniref:MarR family transcriptional regulator n=1 Tax=Natrinema thermotolerans TaxID=121872 RepID=UPI0006790662|nr:MarR family transcriptional regulator [Natrinema thermotolerans]QCC57346.1 MarR family transcriptional regulator [Natrinema thermotolerans]
MTEINVPTAVREGTPAQKLVFKVLEHADEPLDQDAIADRSLLPKRTVRETLSDLEDAGAVTSVTYMPDTRRKLYQIDK